ncbi:hypothetical protein [Nonomuraea dietziae]|uniref:hypothetical protein n=1 Tax=Nonomuraea dietziae TaxID=65515 RepID=UPI00343E8F93
MGDNDATGTFTIPRRPIRRRLQQLPRFTITKEGEYLFMPGLRALVAAATEEASALRRGDDCVEHGERVPSAPDRSREIGLVSVASKRGTEAVSRVVCFRRPTP